MILFKKKLLLTALFATNLGIGVIVSNNAGASCVANICNCIQTCPCPNTCGCACSHHSSGGGDQQTEYVELDYYDVSKGDQYKGFYEEKTFDTIKFTSQSKKNDTIVNEANHWQLRENCSTMKDCMFKNGIFEITSGTMFEVPLDSHADVDLDNSTLYVNEGGKYVYQSKGFNKFYNETKGIFAPRSKIIWNGSNYRLFDAKDNTSFIAYPDSFINALKFDVVHKHHINYFVDGNNKQATFYLNRVKYDSQKKAIPNHNIMAVLLDMNIVLPQNDTVNTYHIKLDESKQFLYCDLYPNLYFENCNFTQQDFTNVFDTQISTDWIIKSSNDNKKNNKKAILSKIDNILTQESTRENQFAEYDIKFGYAKKRNVFDNRAEFSAVYDDKSSQKRCNYNYLVKNGIKYRCYYDLTLFPECFQYNTRVNQNAYTYYWNNGDASYERGILNHLPIILRVGLIGNQNVSLIDFIKKNDYKQVELYGDNTGYSGLMRVSKNVENVIFGEDSYAKIDQLFVSDRSNGQCNVIVMGSNDIIVEGQTINNFKVTKNAKVVRLVPTDNWEKAKFDIGGTTNLEAYEASDDETADDDIIGDGLFVIEEGVEVNA